MVDWSGYSDGGESSRRPPTRWWNPMDWARNDDLGDEVDEEGNKNWLNDRRVQIGVIIIFIIGIALIIAGSIMLGIGISKSNKTCPSCPSVSSSPFYATVESTEVTYQDVLSNYSHAADIVANQVRSALTGSPTSKASFAATSQNTDPFITVLGLSSSPSGSVMAVVGMGYTTADSPGATAILNHLDTAPKLNLYHMAETAASTPDTQMCNAVSTYSQNTQTNAITSTSSSSTQMTTKPTVVTPEPTTSVQTTATTPQTIPPNTSTASSPASSSTTVPTITSVTTSSSSSSSSSSSTPAKAVTSTSSSVTTSSPSTSFTSSSPSSSTTMSTSPTISSPSSSTLTMSSSTSSSSGSSTSASTLSTGSSSTSSTVTSSLASSTSLNPTSTSSTGTTSVSSTTQSSTISISTSTVAPSSTSASSSSTTSIQTSSQSSKGPLPSSSTVTTTSESILSSSTAGLSTTSVDQPSSTTMTVASTSTTVPVSSTSSTVESSSSPVTSASTTLSSSTSSTLTSTVTQVAPITSTTSTYPSSSTSEMPTTCSCPPVTTTCASPSTTASSSMDSTTSTPTVPATGTTVSQSSSASTSVTQSTAMTSTSTAPSSTSSTASTSVSTSSTFTPEVTASTSPPSSSSTTSTSTSPQATSTVEITSSTGMSSSSSTDSSFTSTSTIASSTAPISTIRSTIASSSVAASSTTTSPEGTTTPSCVWPTSTPTVPNRPGARDIVVLIDDSTAVGNFSNYDQIVSWLSHQLFPLWPISSNRWEAAPAQYAEHEYNLLMDFDANSADELSKAVSGSQYSGRNAPSVTKAFKSTLGLAGREGVKRILLLISASSNLTDIENALSLAEMTKGNGADVITFSVGGADGGALGMLSSGSGYAFSSDSFALTAEQAVEITDLIQGQESTVGSTTIASTTTTEPQKDLPCHPDVAVVIDTSSAVSSAEEFNRQLSFISSQLSPSWPISPSGMEAELVIFSSAYGGLLGKGAFSYQNSNEFSEVVDNSYFYYNDFAAPNISGSLEYLVSTQGNRRPARTATTILFTYSGGYSDVAAAQTSLVALGNLVVVSMGNDLTYLYSLSGDVISGMDYGDDMKNKINSLLCQPSTPIPLTSTVASSSSSSTTTTVTMTTTSQQSTSTVTPVGCEDCYPSEANVLIVMDASSLMKAGKLDQLKSFINNDLTAQWNHPERLAILAFDDKTHFDAPMDFGDFITVSEFHQLVSSAPQLPNPPYLPSAFQRALSNFNPLPSFGQMNTVIFTISSNGVDSIGDYANQLAAKGTVVIVGMEMTNTSSLTSLSQNIVSWPNLKDSTGISDQIEQYISPGVTPGTTLTTVSSSTATGTTSAASSSSSPGSTATVTTPIPAACGRDVILMIDESNAFPDADSFQKIQSWLISSLIPQWTISPAQISVAPFGFANKTWDDLGGDFLVNSATELETILSNNLVYRPKTPPSLTSGLRKAVAVSPPRQGAATVIISASDDSGDVNGAINYSEQLKEDGRVVITLAVGPNTNGQLNKLSSGDSFSFASSSYEIPASIAKEISDVLCSSAATESTTIGTSTPGSTSTSPSSSPFSCNPDVAFLFDNSAVNSNASQFSDLILYTANSLISDWTVHPGATEAGISYANAKAGSFAQNPWMYNSRDELREALIASKGEFYGGDASITNLIKSSIGMLTQSRVTQPLNVVMFTFSSDYDDVANAVPLRNILNANFVAVGLGDSDPDILAMLTGNVVTGLGIGDELTNAIDKAICTNSPPVKVPTTSTSSTSTSSTSSSTVTTTAASTTEPVPIGCSDCYPSMENLLILMDISNDQPNSTFAYQKQAVNSLVSTWTHFERVALSSFASTLQNVISYNDLAKNELSTLTKTVNNLEQTTMTADLGKALHQATGIIPDSDYGEQKTILFTATASVSDKATSAAAELRNKGQLIVIGVDMTDSGALEGLASPGDAIPWSNVKDTQFIVDSIMAALGASSPPTPQPAGTSTSSPATSSPTTPATSSMETSSPAVLCSQNFLLLMDESNAIPSAAEFNQLKNWVVSSLFPGLPATAVAPYGYADKDWNPITGGEFLSDMTAVEMLTNISYTYKSQDGSNIAKALKIAASLEVEGSLTTLIISASADPNDVSKAVPFAETLKQEGAVVTLMIGTGDLSSLASDSSLALTSNSFTPDEFIVKKIASAMCTPYTPTSVTSTTTTPMTTVGTTSSSSTLTTTTSSSSTMTSAPTSTSTSSSTMTTTSEATTPFVPDDSYNPAMADIVVIFDVSSAVNTSTLAAQKNLVNTLVINWNHFERVAIMDFASQPNSVAEFRDLASANDLNAYLQAVYQMNTAGDLASALKFAKKHYPVESGMPGRNVLLLTASEDTAGAAQPAAQTLQGDGSIVVVSLAMTDNSALSSIASPGALISFNDFSNTDGVADQINQLLGESNSTGAPGTSASTVTVTSTTIGLTTSQPSLCSQNFLLLMDESNAIPSVADFNQLKNWVVSSLLPGLPSTAVAPYGYADKDWNPITGGEFLSDMPTVEMLTNVSYTYKSQDGPNIAKALKIAASLEVEGSLTTLIISASADPDDISKAAPFAETLKQEGAVVTLMIGTGDLSSLSSDSTLALTSNSFTPDDSIVKKIASAMCTPYTPTSIATTTSTPITTTSTASSSTTTSVTSSTASPTPTTVTTSTIALTTSTSPVTTSTITPDASFNPAMADIVLIFDVSSSVNDSSLTAQKTLISTLVTSWNHFERVGIMYFASQADHIADFGDLASPDDLNVYLQAFSLMNTPADLSSALKFAKKYYGIETGMPGRNVVLLTASEDTAGAAQPAAQALQGEGRVVVVSLELSDNAALSSIASPGALISFNDFSAVDGVSDQINQLLGEHFTGSSTSSSVPSSNTSGSSSTTPGSLCSQNFLLLMDESNAFPSADKFNELKNWVINALLPMISAPTAVAPYGYADKDWNPITGGEFIDDMTSVEMLTNISYSYKSQNGPNLAKALQIAASLDVEGSLTTLIISASADPNDVAKAASYSNSLKQEGNVMTLMLGNGDLSSLASSPALALNSIGFTPDDFTTAKILSFLCNPLTIPPISSTSTSTLTTTSTSTQTTSTTEIPSTSTVTMSSTASSTLTSSSSTTATPVMTTTITPDASFNPSMADIVLIFDVSSSVNDTSLTAQKNLINTLVTSWNHFERVGIMFFAAQPDHLADFEDLSSPADLNGYLQALFLMNTAADLSLALKFAKKYYSVQSGIPERNVVLLTASEDTAGAAQPAAQALQGEGRLVVVSLGLSDNSALSSIASPGSLVSFNDFSVVDGVADQINQLLGYKSPSFSTSSAPSPSTTSSGTVSSTVTSSTSLQPKICTKNLLLLLDESNALPSVLEFAQLRSWLVTTLLPSLPTIAVGPFGYANNDWNPITGGRFLTDIPSVEDLIQNSYTYLQDSGPNITSALQSSTRLAISGSVTTLLISASANPDDVTSAAPFAAYLKEGGPVVTLKLGDAGDLSSLTSDPAFALSSDTFTPDATLVSKIISAICSTPSTTNSPSSTTSSTVAASTTVSTTVSSETTPLASSTTSTARACSKNLLLLLDESNALPGPLEFAELRSWLASTLLPSLPTIAVGPFGYADKDWNPIAQGRFLTDMPSVEELIRTDYNYLPDSAPNITSALQSSTRLVISGSVTTLLISASANPDDVASAAPFAAYMKEGGPVVTLKLGDAGDLASLASDPSFALSSTTFTPDATVVAQIISAICSLPANN